jgi:circadian clock protein KaiB
VYCLDSQKRSRWHMDLCAALQSQLDLVEPPYFLLPGFTATVDRWYDEARQQSVTIAEAYPRALKFQALLNILFGLGHQQWTPNYTLHEACSESPMAVAVSWGFSRWGTWPQLGTHTSWQPGIAC